MPDVLVYVEKHGVVKSDKEGLYVISGLKDGAVAKLTFKKTGYAFDPPSVEATEGDFAEVPEAYINKPAKPPTCAAVSRSQNLLSFTGAANQMKGYGESATTDKKCKKASMYRERIEKSFNVVLKKTFDLPSAVYPCDRKGLEKKKSAASSSFGTLRASAKHAIAICEKKQKAADRLTSNADKAYRQGLRSLAGY